MQHADCRKQAPPLPRRLPGVWLVPAPLPIPGDPRGRPGSTPRPLRASSGRSPNCEIDPLPRTFRHSAVAATSRQSVMPASRPRSTSSFLREPAFAPGRPNATMFRAAARCAIPARSVMSNHAPSFSRPSVLYWVRRGNPTMKINAAWHRRFGPGGGTRRLHHSPQTFAGGASGGDTGSTSVIKARFSSGMVPSLSGHTQVPTITT